MELAVPKGPQRDAANGLASFRPPMPSIAWREELQEMAVGLHSANPLVPAARVNWNVFLTISTEGDFLTLPT